MLPELVSSHGFFSFMGDAHGYFRFSYDFMEYLEIISRLRGRKKGQ
jgi:hypothetical protein